MDRDLIASLLELLPRTALVAAPQPAAAAASAQRGQPSQAALGSEEQQPLQEAHLDARHGTPAAQGWQEDDAGGASAASLPSTRADSGDLYESSEGSEDSEEDEESATSAGRRKRPRTRTPPAEPAAAALPAAAAGGLRLAVGRNSVRGGFHLGAPALNYLFGAHTLPLEVLLLGPGGEEWAARVSPTKRLACRAALRTLGAPVGGTLVLRPAGTRAGKPAATVAHLRAGSEPGAAGQPAAARARASPALPPPPPPRRASTPPHVVRTTRWECDGGEEALIKAATVSLVEGGVYSWGLPDLLRLAGSQAPPTAVLFTCAPPPTSWRKPVGAQRWVGRRDRFRAFCTGARPGMAWSAFCCPCDPAAAARTRPCRKVACALQTCTATCSCGWETSW
jgi:hypothetical protein